MTPFRMSPRPTVASRRWRGATDVAPAVTDAGTVSPLAVEGPKPDALIYAVGGLVLTFIWRVQDLFPVLALLRPSLLIEGLAILLLIQARSPLRRLSAIKSPLTLMTGGLFVMACLSVPTALWAGNAFKFLTQDYLQTMVFFVLVCCAPRGLRDVRALLAFNGVGAVIFAYFAVFRFTLGARGRLGGLAYYDANDASMHLVGAMFMALIFVGRSRPTWVRAATFLSLPLVVLAIVRCGSRGSFLAMLITTIYLIVRYRTVRLSRRLTTVALGVTLLIGIAGESYWTLMKTLLEPEKDYNYAGNSETGRIEVWKRGIGYMMQRPLTGVGVRNYDQAEGMLSEEGRAAAAQGKGWKWSVAHNAFVEIGVETGVIGLALFIALMLGSLRTLDGWATEDRAAQMAHTLAAMFLSFILCSIFLSSQYFAGPYFLIGLTVGLVKLRRTVGSAPAAAASPMVGRRVARSALGTA